MRRSERGRHATPTIRAYEDGPYLVRGAVTVLDEDGREVDVHRATIALCRCGRSRLKPLCDGTHKLIGFRAPGTGAVPVQAVPEAEREGLRPAG